MWVESLARKVTWDFLVSFNAHMQCKVISWTGLWVNEWVQFFQWAQLLRDGLMFDGQTAC